VNTQISDNLRGVDRWLFNNAKLLAFVALCSRLAGFATGIVGILWSAFTPFAPYAVGALVMVAAVADHYSEGNRSTAESILRKLEFEEGLGWKISDAERADLLANVPERARAQQLAQNQKLGSYFDSKKPVGALKAIEDIEESAWWTKHLSAKMRTTYGVLSAGLIAGSILALIAAAIFVSSLPQVLFSDVARIVTAVLSLGVGLGLSRFWVSFGRLYVRSAKIQEQAKVLREVTPTEADAIKLYADYHLARASAPPIPTWIWKTNEKKLNRIWQQTLTNR
jgi:hypothetical protein